MEGKILTLRAPRTASRIRVGHLKFVGVPQPLKSIRRRKKRRGR